MIKIKKIKNINEIEVFVDDDNESENDKISYVQNILKNKNLPEKEFNGFTFKFDNEHYIMLKNNKLIGIFSFEKVNGLLCITYRWISEDMRGKGIYDIFLRYLKSNGIDKIVSDQLMTKAAIASTLKLQGKYDIQFINIDTKETLPINDENLKKYITTDYDYDTFPWRFLIRT